MSNLKAISNFREQLKNPTQLMNGDIKFNGLITYYFGNKILKEALAVTIRLTTMEHGQVSIADGEEINSDVVHMEFNPAFQNYEYMNDYSLKISDRSNRLGHYEVRIVEI